MEIVDNAVVLAVPGAMEAGLGTLLFWGSLSFALAIAFVAAVPVNRWLIARGKGHAAVHRTGIPRRPQPEAGRLDRRLRLRVRQCGPDRRSASWVSQALGKNSGVRLRALQPQGQRAQAAQAQVALQRAGGRPAELARVAQRLRMRVGPLHRGPEQQIGMAAHRLDGAVDHDIGAEFERALQQRCGERVVDPHSRPRSRATAHRREVGDAQQRIARRLRPQHGRPIAGAEHRLGVGDVDQRARSRRLIAGSTTRDNAGRGLPPDPPVRRGAVVRARSPAGRGLPSANASGARCASSSTRAESSSASSRRSKAACGHGLCQSSTR